MGIAGEDRDGEDSSKDVLEGEQERQRSGRGQREAVWAGGVSVELRAEDQRPKRVGRHW